MTNPLLDDLRPFVPARLGPKHLGELDQAIEAGSESLREYEAWLIANRKPLDSRTIVTWHFVAANCKSDVLRATVIGWLDFLTGPAN